MNKKVIISGSIWTTASTITTAAVQVLRLSILAHFLEKSDFGVVALLTMILGFTNMFSEMGFSTIIMHKKDISQQEFCSLYWAQFFVYAVIYLIITQCSFLLADFFNEPSITNLLPITMLDLLFYGIGRLYETVMQKELRFNVLAKRNIIASITSLFLAGILAYNGAGVYSLILSTLTHTIILNLWNLIQGVKSIPLKLYCSFKLIRPMFSMGIYQTGSHILDYFSTKLDVLIIGKMLGSEALGIYSLAQELILKGIMLVNSIVNRVSLPLFAKKQENKDSLRRNYCKLISYISFINFPICTIIGVLGCIIVPVLYGNEYEDVIPILFILSLWGNTVCLGNPVGNIVIATGRTDLSLIYTLIRFMCYIPCMYVMSTYNIYVLAWGTALLNGLFVFISWYMQLYKTIELRIKQFVSSFMHSFIYTLCAGIAGYLFMDYIKGNHAGYLPSIGYAALWCVLYMTVYVLIQKRTLIEIKNMLIKR